MDKGMMPLGLLWIAIYVLHYSSEWYIHSKLLDEAGHGGSRKRDCLILAFLKTGILLMGAQLHMPLPILYVWLLLGYGLTFLKLLRKNKLRFCFWLAFYAICFIALHLIGLGVLSLAAQDILLEIYRNDITYLVAFLAPLIFMQFLNLLWRQRSVIRKLSLLTKDERRFRQLIYFEGYALVYLFFDSIPILFELPYLMLSIFLTGSCILLLLQFFLFLSHTYTIAEKAHYEAEYHKLEEEREEYIKRKMILHNLAYMDGLTGAFTRRYAMEMLESMQKDQMKVTVAYIDVNGLKRVNDTWGHLQGDQYLKKVANCLNDNLHKSDILARIGGDEFLVVSSNAGCKKMEEMLEKANMELMERDEDGYRPSFSYGVAAGSCERPFVTEELLRESDHRMYEYKTRYKEGGIV